MEQFTQQISREQFENILKGIGCSPKINKDILFDLFENAIVGANTLSESNLLGKYIPVNPVILALYLHNEYLFYLDVNRVTNEDIEDDEIQLGKIVSLALDKYITNEHLNFSNESKVSRFNPQISSLNTYINFLLGVLKKYKEAHPKNDIVPDIMNKGIKMEKAILELIVDGFETEAFSTWRTLHETECILSLLMKNGAKTIESYLTHMKYAMAFRGVIPNKEEVDAIFVEIKARMAELSLKSKDMKKFIEYGWLTSVPGFLEMENYKFNFRDGVEKLAGLETYSKTYELASEIAHSSPLLIYSQSQYFYHLTMINLIETFFRFEEMFLHFYKVSASEDDFNRYLEMRKVYIQQIRIIYTIEATILRNSYARKTKTE
ncbi:MAG: DUF5677 domain-containing protein [Clostridia bacterium]|nr:DUF5677 domain-containing protein [Clostridia bacterium]